MVETAGGDAPERVLLVMQKATDVKWGGFMNLYLTDRRFVVEKVMGNAAGAMLAGGVAGVMIAQHVAGERGQRALEIGRTPDEVLAAEARNYAIDYSTVSHLTLKRKSPPIGYSGCKIESSQKKVTLAFKREHFEQVVELMREVLGDKLKVK